jgi:hypothetical protein
LPHLQEYHGAIVTEWPVQRQFEIYPIEVLFIFLIEKKHIFVQLIYCVKIFNMKNKPARHLIFFFVLGINIPGFSQTITSLARIASPTLPNAGLIANGGFETGAPPVNTWYQWAKTGCVPTPANRNPPSWTVTSNASNAAAGNPVRYATWGRLVTGTGPSAPYPNIPTTQSGLYEVYSISSTACINTNTTATSTDPGTFPLGVASADGNNYLYFGNGTGSITGFPTPLAAWVSSTSSPNNLRVYTDNSSLGTLTGPSPVTLAQTITTVNGSAYILEFWVSGEELDLGTQKDGFFQLEIGAQKLYLAIPGSGNNHGLGSQFYYQVKFNAASTSTLIRFTNYCHPVAGNWAGYLAGTVSSELILDDVRMNLASVLPVRLISFDANRNSNNVTLSWKVADEINFSHYEIERSFDLSQPYTSVGTVGLNNNGTGMYSFTDGINNYLQKDVIYYRLKMIDRDGAISYSNVVRVKLNTKSPVIISPTILKQGEIITIEKNNLFGEATMQVTNMSGQIITTEKFTRANIFYLKTNNWAAGTYIVSVISEQTKNNYKVIVQ